MSTVTALVAADEPLPRTVRPLPPARRRERPGPPEAPEPGPLAAPAAAPERGRPAHCRFAMHYED
ncbi:hypothetical protein [Kitasatospora sp. NPDC018619]|uniref:hypothetical protein n=1 Tax=unclassified Kitasatospora TaxID=2633591 RepID=UPI003793738E